MSLIGIDLGSSNIKAAAYTVDGVPLASARRSVRTNRTEAGHSEIDVFESREVADRVAETLGQAAAVVGLAPPDVSEFETHNLLHA